MAAEVEAEVRKFILDNETLQKVSSLLLEQFQKGLSKTTNETGCLKMLLTYVQDIPDGSEKGKFLALDLGGSNFRILCIDLYPKSSKIDIQSEKYEIAKSVMIGTGQELFDYIADCLSRFIKTLKLKEKCLPLGFTFSFPCTQTSLNSAILLRWTKGFSCSGVVGKNVGQLLEEAIARQGDKNVKILSVVNDTTGTLMSCAHKDPNCGIGLIVGTGTNACYIENLDNIKKWTPNYETNSSSQMIINTEWCAFGDDNSLNFIRTKYDDIIDKTSLHQGEQIFEKMISGMYLGELVRLILVDLTKHNLLFNGELSDELETKFLLQTEWLSLIQDDLNHNRSNETMKILLNMLKLRYISKEDCEAVKDICTKVVERSAFLVSAGIATILNKMKRPQTTIGVDGSLFRFHPTYETLMESKIKELTDPHYKFKLMLSEDGSGRGAALIAAVALGKEINN